MNQAARAEERLEAEEPRRAVVACWSCKGAVPLGEPFCGTCQAVQPPGDIDHFARYGLRPSFDLDEEALELRYLDLQRRLHPDRFANRTGSEKIISQQQAVGLNEAYEVLASPLRRAAYLLDLNGVPADISDSRTIDDPELLMEAMEAREALAGAGTVEEVAAMAQAARENQSACERTISECFAADDLEGAKRAVIRLKYIQKLVEEARRGRAKLASGPR